MASLATGGFSMRVLLVTHRYPPDGLGGVERYTQTLAAELVKNGVTVSIVTRRPVSAPPEPRIVRERLSDGTALFRFVGGKKIFMNRPLAHYERLEQLFTLTLAETAPDIVHFNHLLGLSPRFIAIAYRLRIAVVLSLHDFYFSCPLVHLQKESGGLCRGPDSGRECASSCFADEPFDPTLKDPNPLLRWGTRAVYFRRLFAMAQRVVCHSRYVASHFAKFGPNPTRLHIIPLGISTAAANPVAWPPVPAKGRDTLNLAFCGTVAPHKGVHTILDALRIANLSSVNLLVLGDIAYPSYARELREGAASVPGLKLQLYGAYEIAKLSCLLQDVDCVIAPSLVPETGGLVPREALAHGIPVLAARLGALPEIVADGENGFTFDPRRPEELAAILKRLAWDESLLNRLRQGARRTKVVTLSEHAAAIRSVYREALGELAGNEPTRDANLAEIGLLHAALLDFGLGDAEGPAA
jgi:glycosyltransferase involved in cell wall biosynthesis